MNENRISDKFGIVLNAPYSISSKEIHKYLEQSGFIVFKKWANNREDFKNLSELLSDKFITHGAKVRRSVDHESTQTVTKGPDKIILHFEMHYSPIAPDYMWFYCESAPKKGGETTLGSGTEIYNALSSSTLNVLHEKGILYKNIWAKETIEKYFPKTKRYSIIEALGRLGAQAQFLDNGELQFFFKTSPFNRDSRGNWVFGNTIAIHHQYKKNIKLFQEQDQTLRHEVSFGDGTPIPDSIFTEIEELSEKFVLPYKWEQGDIVLVDNHSVLHGRNSYDPKEEREILVRMGIKQSNPANFIFEPKKLENAS